jgi:catechol 2,3-dioxygenase-like lactoylglutathione lyase family enzyme
MRIRLSACFLAILGAFAVFPHPVFAQTDVLPIIDHVHLAAPDQAQAVEWYRTYFSGEPMQEGPERLLFGKVRVIFQRSDKAIPSAGGAVDHIGFSVPDIEATMNALEGSGAKITQPVKEVNGLFKLAFIEDPWGTRIEIVQDPEFPGLHHIHLRGADPAAILAWYRQQFPAGVSGRLKDRIDGLNYGGVWVLVQRGEAAPSRGRSIDHIGFRPVNVDTFVAAAKTRSVTVTTEPRPLTLKDGATIRLAFIESPDGVRIELVQR